MLPKIQDFMGKGIALPFRGNPETGDIQGASEEENVKNSIRMFLSTLQGERVFFEDYGMPKVLFATFSAGVEDMITHTVKTGLRLYEPRVVVTDVRVTKVTSGVMKGINVHVVYRIRSTGRADSLVHVLANTES